MRCLCSSLILDIQFRSRYIFRFRAGGCGKFVCVTWPIMNLNFGRLCSCICTRCTVHYFWFWAIFCVVCSLYDLFAFIHSKASKLVDRRDKPIYFFFFFLTHSRGLMIKKESSFLSLITTVQK